MMGRTRDIVIRDKHEKETFHVVCDGTEIGIITQIYEHVYSLWSAAGEHVGTALRIDEGVRELKNWNNVDMGFSLVGEG